MTKRENLLPWIVFAGLVATCALGRWLAPAENFAPVAAAALFAGFFFRGRLVAALVPMLGLTLSNFLLPSYGSKLTMAAVYLSFLFPVLLRSLVRRRLSAGRIGWTAAFSSVVFFLASNFAVWLPGKMYDRTWEGLCECYAAGLLFFGNTLAGDLFYAGVFFGTYAVAMNYVAGPRFGRMIPVRVPKR